MKLRADVKCLRCQSILEMPYLERCDNCDQYDPWEELESNSGNNDGFYCVRCQREHYHFVCRCGCVNPFLNYWLDWSEKINLQNAIAKESLFENNFKLFFALIYYPLFFFSIYRLWFERPYSMPIFIGMLLLRLFAGLILKLLIKLFL